MEIIGRYEALADERRIFERMLGKMAEFTGSTVTAATPGTETRDVKELSDILSLAGSKAAAELGKQLSFRMEAEALSLPEKRFLSLKEGLLHLVRNSVAHGIEDPEERRSKGKNSSGKIAVKLENKDGELLIDYSDDGKGLDLETIRKTVVMKGLKSEKEAASLVLRDLVKYIFLDGFSTKAETDMVSGQGAGLAVVKRTFVSDLKGSIKLTKGPSGGLGFKIRVPCAAKEEIES